LIRFLGLVLPPIISAKFYAAAVQPFIAFKHFALKCSTANIIREPTQTNLTTKGTALLA
jgi:hypothetical protein